MPTVKISHSELISKIGNLTEEQVEDLCWRYGLELDEVTSEYEIVKREQGPEKAKNCSKEKLYKIDVPANRYDLLCCEGLTRALMIFEEKMSTPHYTLKPNVANIVLNVDSSTNHVRPFCVAAILRNVTFDEASYESFMSLQDKLHQNIGKRRHIVSMGTHDLDTVKPPFTYVAKKPSDIKFIPLNETKEFTAEELMVHYSKESHLKPYLSIIRDCDVYPVIYDSQGIVLSMPPIINGDHTKIKLTTKNVFIEITGTNFHKISVALDTMVTMFSEYCGDQFSIEPVEMHLCDGSVIQTPELTYRSENVSVDYINNRLGTSLNGDEMAKLLHKMCLNSHVINSSNNTSESMLTVTIPPTRHDIIHPCDISGNVAIAYGYDNISEPKTVSISGSGGDTLVNKLSDEIRILMTQQQFTEPLSFVLCSKDDISTKLGKKISDVPAVHISNPKTPEFQVVRTCLLPGILNTIQSNQHLSLPLRLFEVQDVVHVDSNKDVGASNKRRVCAVHYGNVPGFEDMYNVMTTVMLSVGCVYKKADDLVNQKGEANQKCYTIEEIDDSMLMSGRSFKIVLENGLDIGRVGILKQSILKNFGLKKGFASMMEIDIDSFV